MLLNNDIYNLYYRSPYPQLTMYILLLYSIIVVLFCISLEPFGMYYIYCHRYRVCNIVNCQPICRYIVAYICTI